ncbi:hypothetical protein K491DRAFT_616169, partial [Lophiostoma macrostomum CBS 122681]
LLLKLEKYKFYITKIKYLEYIISKDRVKINSKLIKAIIEKLIPIKLKGI